MVIKKTYLKLICLSRNPSRMKIRKINFLTKNLKFYPARTIYLIFKKKRHELIQFIEGKIFNGNLNEFIRIFKAL